MRLLFRLDIICTILASIYNLLAISCPDGCQCEENALKCYSLSEVETTVLLSRLSEEFSNIQTLSIEDSPFVSITRIPSLSNLNTLVIDNCTHDNEQQLEKATFPNVKFLQLTRCNITALSRFMIAAFPRVEHLDISHNNIDTFGIDSLHLTKLTRLDASFNKLKSLGVHILRYMLVLKELNLSHNLMTRLVTSDFYSAMTLHKLNLSYNKINVIECDTSTLLNQIEELDLSYNQLSHIPGDAIRNMEQMFHLNISGNPIGIVTEAALRLPNLQILDISHCEIKVVEPGAFSYLPYLHTLYLNDNPNMLTISASAIQNISSIFSIDLRNTGLRRIPTGIISSISRLYISKTRLDCACLVQSIDNIGGITIMDWNEATCATKTGVIHRLSDVSKSVIPSNDMCREELLVPIGEHQEAMVGDSYRIHCLGNVIPSGKMHWILPDRRNIVSVPPELSDQNHKLDYFTTSLFDPNAAKRKQNRTHATTEYFGFDIVLSTDSGVYECVSKGKQTVSRRIKFVVKQPEIYLNASHVGITSVHLTWNKNLHVKAVDRIALQVTAESGTEFKRQVQLSLYNMFCSYNLINLSPDKEYNICLQWIMTDDQTVIYKSCISQWTRANKGILESIGIELAILGIIACAIGFFCCGSCIFQRFNVLAYTKRDSKMQQSVSGQSMLSTSVASTADATMYENFQLQMSPSFHDPMA